MQRIPENSIGRDWRGLAKVRPRIFIKTQRKAKLKRPEAEQAYKQAIRQSPGNAEFVNSLVTLYGQQEEWAKALDAVNSALQVTPFDQTLLKLKNNLDILTGKKKAGQ